MGNPLVIALCVLAMILACILIVYAIGNKEDMDSRARTPQEIAATAQAQVDMPAATETGVTFGALAVVLAILTGGGVAVMLFARSVQQGRGR